MIIDDLVLANKILFNEGVVDAFGHVSVRDPDNPHHFFMAQGKQPPFVGPDDILGLDLNGNKVNPDQPGKPSMERFIYSEIYRVRPDVMAIVHSHAEEVLPFTIARDTPLRALHHNGGFLGAGAPVFEIRDWVGEASNMLVGDKTLGQGLAKMLGVHTVVLMRGHGFTVVGGSIKEAVYNAVNTVASARIQLNAIRLGTLIPLSQGEASAASKIHKTALDRNWEVWTKRALRQMP